MQNDFRYNVVIIKDKNLVATYFLETTKDHKHQIYSEQSAQKTLNFLVEERPELLNISGRELARLKNCSELEFVPKENKHSDEICSWRIVTKKKEEILLKFFLACATIDNV